MQESRLFSVSECSVDGSTCIAILNGITYSLVCEHVCGGGVLNSAYGYWRLWESCGKTPCVFLPVQKESKRNEMEHTKELKTGKIKWWQLINTGDGLMDESPKWDRARQLKQIKKYDKGRKGKKGEEKMEESAEVSQRFAFSPLPAHLFIKCN